MKWFKTKLPLPDIFAEQSGYILGLVMVFFVVFSIIGMTFLKMGSHERIQTHNYYNKVKAFYQAEAGIYKGVWLANKVSNIAATFNDSTVIVVYDSVNLIMTATGTAGSAQKTVQVTLESSGGGGGSSGNETLRPIGRGEYSQNKKSGCGKNWQCVDETTADGDETYVRAKPEEWKTDTYITEDGSGTGTIDSVVTYIRVRELHNEERAWTVILISGISYYGTVIDPTSSYMDYSTTYTTNPYTLASWTWADVNAMQIGVRLYKVVGNIKGPRCTQMWSEVHYNGGGGGSTLTINTWEEL